MIRVGLTGGIGSGKSTVLQFLTNLGTAAIDADAISRSVTAPGGAAIPAIVQRFGAGFIGPDGALDRERMRQQVYADPLARRQLEAIIHPLVGQEIERQVEDARSLARRCVVFDIPLLVESGRWRAKLDRVLVVDCHPDTQLRRVQARSGLAVETIRGIIAAQATRAQRLAAADLVIFNDQFSLAQLQCEVEQAAKSFGL